MAKKLNKWQNEILKLENQASKQLEKDLKETYEEILKDVRREIRAYGEEFEDLPYYKQVRAGNLRQLQNEVVEMLNSAEPEVNRRIIGFKESEMVEGYFQSMYQVEMESMQPIDFMGLTRDFVRTSVEKPVSGQRLSSRLYKYRDRLAKKAQSAITVGISQGMAYEKIADRIRNATESNYKQALRIARTEGGRLRSEAKDIAYQEAADKGVKFQEMWVSALDSKTRSTHRSMDGQVVEVGEDFKSPSGASGPGPRLLGSASEDINCRCTKIATFEGQPPLLRRDGEGRVLEYQSYNDWVKNKNISEITLDFDHENDIFNDIYGNISMNKKRRSFAKDIINATGHGHVTVGIRKINSRGYNSFDMNRTNEKFSFIDEFVLQSNDDRLQHYQQKTAFHEAFHLNMDGREWDRTSQEYGKFSWLDIEETFAETSAHYAMQVMGNRDFITPSYSDILPRTLPALKKTETFKNSVTLEDFGKVAWQNRLEGSGAKWLDLAKEIESHSVDWVEYAYDNYGDYLNDNKDFIIDKIAELQPSSLDNDHVKDLLKDDLSAALKNVKSADDISSNNQNFVLSNAVTIAMKVNGVR